MLHRYVKEEYKMKIVAVTACPTGIAHTYMAQEAIEKDAKNADMRSK